ncbi:MAG: PKD domain-containing protein, partial [Acidobacteriota bacterium]
MRKELKWTLVLALVCVLAGSWACKLDEVIPPELAGPSELALSLEMRAIPDQLTADGFSSSIIEAVLRDENGQRLPGRTINFDLTVRGQFLDIGNLAPLNGPRPTAGGEEARAVSALTDGDGVARARYWAPFRTDQENDIVVTITGRPAGTDFRAALLRQVDIFVRAANRPSFPGGATCAILVEPQDTAYAVGDLIFFTAAQLTGANGNSIARYEWVFGDGSPRREGRNVEHAYSSTGTFTVTLFTTESVTGAQDSCTEDIGVTATGAPAPPAPGACPTASASFATSGTCDSGEILAG